MTTQTELEIGLGNTAPEKVSLKPAKVKIVSVEVTPTARAKKITFEVKHPEKEETIHISSVAYLDGREVKVAGTWLNLDKDGKIQMYSSLWTLLNKLSATSINDTVGKEIETELDGKYLCFKAY